MRWLIYGVAAALLLVAGGVAILAVKVIEAGPSSQGRILGQPTIGGPFSLVDGDGGEVTDQSFPGKHLFVYFGFTYCPDICPTELVSMSDALDLLKPEEAAAFQPIFITIDPDRDTPAVVKEYVANFHDRMVGLTGTPEQIKQAASAYRVYYAKQESENGRPYQMAHSSYIYVVDPDGLYVRHFSVGKTADEIAEGLRATLRGERA